MKEPHRAELSSGRRKLSAKQKRAEAKRILLAKEFDLLRRVMRLPPGQERWDYIRRHGTSGCGFTAITLARFGVKWPPKKGWRSRIVYDETAQIEDEFAEPRLSKLMGERI